MSSLTHNQRPRPSFSRHYQRVQSWMQGSVHDDESTRQRTHGQIGWRNERTVPNPTHRTVWQDHNRNSQEICIPCFVPRHPLLSGGDCIHQFHS